MTETEIRREILDHLHSLDVFCWVYHNRATPGRKNNVLLGGPDIEGLLSPHGRYFCVETKTKNGKLRPHQEIFKINVESNGGVYIIARGIEDLTNYVELFDKKHNPYGSS
jgi:hypothetical protein